MRVLPLVPVLRNPDQSAQNDQNRPHLVASQNGQVFPIPNPLQSIQSNSLLSTFARLMLHERSIQQRDSSLRAVSSGITTSYANTASTAIPSMFPALSLPLSHSVPVSLSTVGIAGALPLPVLTALDSSISLSSKGQVMSKIQNLATTDPVTPSKSGRNLAKQISPPLIQPQELPNHIFRSLNKLESYATLLPESKSCRHQ